MVCCYITLGKPYIILAKYIIKAKYRKEGNYVYVEIVLFHFILFNIVKVTTHESPLKDRNMSETDNPIRH